MHLAKLKIKNFRCFEDQEIEFDPYTCFVGDNGSGKSTVLMALNVFFRNNQAPSDVINLQEEDFHIRNTKEPIEIECTFKGLSDSAREDFQAYVRQSELTIKAKAVWSPDTGSAEVNQYGSRRVVKDFIPFFEAHKYGEKVSVLKEKYNNILKSYPDLPPAGTKEKMRSTLRDYEEKRPEICENVESSDQFYGWSRASNLLNKYIQWIYIPAVKDPTEEQDEQRNSALGNLLERTVRTKVDFSEPFENLRQQANKEYQRLIKKQNSELVDIKNRIEKQLRNWAHPGAKVEIKWHFDENRAVSITNPFARAKVGEGDFLGEIVRSGHGMQRSFLIAMLQVLASISEDEHNPTMLLGFEEPELYQHPPQSKHLVSLLEQLSLKENQIIVTTHSPLFVSSKGFENIRLVQRKNNDSSIEQYKYNQLSSKLAEVLGEDPLKPTEIMAAIEQILQPSQAELFFCKLPIFVEGPEDIAFISTVLKVKNKWEKFRQLGCHFIICNGKTNMSRPVAIALGFGLSPFVIFDGDCDKIKKPYKDNENIRDNSCLLKLLGSSIEPNQDENVIYDNFVMWKTRIHDEISSEIGEDRWLKYENIVRKEYLLQSGVRRKNPLLITATVEHLLKDGIEIDVLNRVTENILNYAKNHKS